MEISKQILTFLLLVAFFVDALTGQTTNSPATASENAQQCSPYNKAPVASTLKCSQAQCNATCTAKYKFPKGETTLSIDCVNKVWTIKNLNYKNLKELPGCLPICNPLCANKGKCIAPNRCQCTPEFQGATCREKACRQPPAMTQNSKRTCKPSQCTVTCLPGFKFKTAATTMILQCKNGNWISSSRGLSLSTHCDPHCNPKCLNGGKCVGGNKCQCTDKFRGPQCQHATDRCSPKKFGFNGSFNCMGSETEMSCSLECPDGINFEFAPAPIYKCKFADGKFTPLPMPKCVYGPGVQVVEQKQVPAKPKSVTLVAASRGPTCNLACQNGGTCHSSNTCQCSKSFAGRQCQFSVDRCSILKAGFNGGFKCAGSQTGMTCTLHCPPEIDFEFTPAAAYTCDFSTGKFTPVRIPKCVFGEGFEVIQRAQIEEKPDKMTTPTCSQSCQNGGTCVYHNTCQCLKNFAGPQCQYSVDRCSPLKMGFNGGVRCSGTQTGMSCTLSCPPGINFDFSPAAAYECEYATGVFSPARQPKCVYGEGVEVIQRVSDGESGEATCSRSCQNGGTCVFRNMCQCPKNFRGPQCQYSIDRCSIKNTSFNGGFRCSGSSTEMSCTLNCPEGIEYDFPPAAVYICKYETGTFSPSRIPNCVFGEGVEVIRRVTTN